MAQGESICAKLTSSTINLLRALKHDHFVMHVRIKNESYNPIGKEKAKAILYQFMSLYITHRMLNHILFY